MKRKKTKLASLALALIVLTALLPATPAMAEEYGEISFGTTYTGELSREGFDRYTVTLTSAGRVTIGLSTSSSGMGLVPRWYDDTGSFMYQTSNMSANNSRHDFERGTYFLDIYNPSSSTSYNLTLSFTPARNDDTRPNNTFDTATLLTSGQSYIGFLSRQYSTAMFEYRLQQTGSVRVSLVGSDLNFSTGSTNLRTRWFDANGQLAGSRGTVTNRDVLESGTYYIEVYHGSGVLGSYSLKVEDEASAPTQNQFTITATAGTGGTVTGGGTFQQNASVTLSAAPNTGYTFEGWYEGSTRVSTSATYTFNATANRTLEARFVGGGFTVTVIIQPEGGGSVSGDGAFRRGDNAYLFARPNPGYSFIGWFVPGGGSIQIENGLSFMVTGNRTIEARFMRYGGSNTTVPNNHSSWARPELERAIELDLIPLSLKDSSIDYTKPITRAEFAGVAVRTFEILSGTTALPAVTNPFKDTNDLDVLKAFNADIMIGVSSTEFAPNTILNREQAATALTRVFKRATMPGWTYETDANFTLNYTRPAPFADDASISGWAKDSVYFMNAYDIIRGVGNNMFAPRATTTAQQAEGYANATREQALLIALRMVENLR